MKLEKRWSQRKKEREGERGVKKWKGKKEEGDKRRGGEKVGS